MELIALAGAFALFGLSVYLRTLLPAARGTLALLSDAIDLYERLQGLRGLASSAETGRERASAPPKLPEKVCADDSPTPAAPRSTRAGQ